MSKLFKCTVVVVAWLFVAVEVKGQISVFSADGSLSVTGWAQASPLVVTNYSMMAPQGDLSASADAHSQGVGLNSLNVSASASSQASQSYSISPNTILWSSSLKVNTWSQLQDLAGQCAAQAQSVFQLSFGVLSPSFYQLTLDDFSQFRSDAPLGNLNFSCSLASSDQGSICRWNYGDGPIGGTYAGLLVPGEVYTFAMSMAADANWPDPLGELNSISANVGLNVVPEPSSILVFYSGLAILPFLCRRRRLT